MRTFVNKFSIACLLIVACGCGRGNYVPPGPSDPAQAKQALTQALDAWRSGNKIESMPSSSPAVIVSDEEWASGTQLLNYEIQGDGKTFGTSVRLNATLELRGSGGQTQRKKALYQVATNPVLTVSRSDANEDEGAATAPSRRPRE